MESCSPQAGTGSRRPTSTAEPWSRACIRTAFRLYGGILDEVERAGYDVFGRRATVPTWRRLAVAFPSIYS